MGVVALIGAHTGSNTPHPQDLLSRHEHGSGRSMGKGSGASEESIPISACPLVALRSVFLFATFGMA